LFDVLILGGRLVDGTGNPWYNGDIGILGGRIEAIGDLKSEGAARKIRADKLTVAPGFIDIHSHGDFTFFGNPGAISKAVQGVTTEVVGNCGISCAPVKTSTLELTRQYVEQMSVATKPDWSWRTVGEYMRKMEQVGMGVNQAILFGHGTLRSAVMGLDDRAPSDTELGEMRRMAGEAALDGAVGMSSGLIYPPGAYAKAEELIEIARELVKHGAMYSSHIRGEHDMVVQAVEECIKVGEETGISVQISHLKAVGRDNWGRSFRLLELMEEARSRGVEVTADVYPYLAGSSSVTITMPPWALVGGMDKLVERLKAPETRSKIRSDIETTSNWENLIKKLGYENVVATFCRNPGNKKYEGKSIAEIATMMRKDPLEAWFDFLIDDGAGGHEIEFYGSDHDLEAIMAHPLVMFCSDMWTFGATTEGEGRPHPRAYGAFPRILGRYVRESKLLSLEEAVRKMTSAPAQKIGAHDRGLLKPGMWADVVVFNQDTILDRATYENPYLHPVGIELVLVNGVVTVEKDAYLGQRAGRVVRRMPVERASGPAAN